MMKLSFLGLLTGVALLASAATAQTSEPSTDEIEKWQICNETSFIVRMASAVKTEEKITSKGWTRLRPGQCVDGGAPMATVRYVYAESSKVYSGGIREWKGTMPLCIGETDFTASHDKSCAQQGLTTQLFMSVSDHDPITRLIETDNFGSRADVAGLQRLLQENGYSIRRVDGVSGRRTSRTVATYLKDKKLAANLTEFEQIDALEKTALAGQDATGLNVCNKTASNIWIATGHKRAENWESRGWWEVAAGECAQPVTDSLKDRDMYLFARQEVSGQSASGVELPDKYLKNDAATSSQFCIAEAKFSAFGREDCSDNGYEAVNFRALPTDADGTIVNLTDSDFVAANLNGLRR